MFSPNWQRARNRVSSAPPIGAILCRGCATIHLMDAQAAKQAIVEYCRKRGALAVGVADLAACERIAPPGHRPSDLFPRVKSVISVGVGGQTQGAWQLPAKAMA